MLQHPEDFRRILRRRHVEARTGISKTGIYNRLNPCSVYFDPEFPKPVKIGKSAVGWDANEVDAWIMRKLEQRTMKNG